MPDSRDRDELADVLPEGGAPRPGEGADAADDGGAGTPRTGAGQDAAGGTRRRPLLALGALLPLAAAAAAVVELPPRVAPEAERAATTARPGLLTLLVPGPVQVPDEVLDTATDADLAVTPPSTAVAVGAIALETDSSLLFGRVSGSETRRDEQGEASAPALTLEDTEDSEGDALDATVTAGAIGNTVLGASAVEGTARLGAATAEDDRPVADAVQSTLTPSGDYRSLALTRALPPSTEGIFLGLTTTAGSSAQLVLRNPSSRPATAALQVWTPDGPAAMSGRSQVVVAPGEEQSVLLESIVPDQEALALEVAVQGSPLAMHLQLSERSGLTPGGVEILTPIAAPDRDLVIPGVEVAGTAPTLVLANLRAQDTTAQVEVLGPDGVIDEGSPGEVPVTGESVTTLALESLPDGAVTVRVRADAAICAAVRSPIAGADLAGSTLGAPVDLAVLVPAPSLTSSGIVALPPGGGHGWLTLAAEADTTCTLITVAADATTSEPIVRELAADTSTVVADPSLRAGGAQPVAVVVVPDQPGAVRAAWMQREQDGAGGVLHSAVTVVPSAATGEGTSIRVEG
ncbi:DUF5719 family protein [Brachybacterium sp. NBEC-018]|uniref:DUF5719 family protein n=1 Tax=Brachybacterium sp. NBEC-018 TaxID=2996004 RepID=UPI0021753CF0|nr:DUF5719 family protein [Brachybacterium sp. NBEC-018]UVY82436.1 DUF5719 family protein [Brachybacterium sp. NBEC-018]